MTDSESPPQSDSKLLCFGISSPGLQITTTSFPTAYYGAYFSQTVHASGGTTPYKWSGATGGGDINLPGNLTLNKSTGQVTGNTLYLRVLRLRCDRSLLSGKGRL